MDTIRQNLIEVLQYARDNYKESNELNPIAEGTLIRLESDQDVILREAVELQCALDADYIEDNSDLDNIDEGTNVDNLKIIKEGPKGEAISVMVNGHEYRYVPIDKSVEELFKSVNGMMKHAKAGYRALNYLKKNAILYYGSKKTSSTEDANEGILIYKGDDILGYIDYLNENYDLDIKPERCNLELAKIPVPLKVYVKERLNA